MNSYDRITKAKNAAKAVILTLTEFDYATVVKFNSNA